MRPGVISCSQALHPKCPLLSWTGVIRTDPNLGRQEGSGLPSALCQGLGRKLRSSLRPSPVPFQVPALGNLVPSFSGILPTSHSPAAPPQRLYSALGLLSWSLGGIEQDSKLQSLWGHCQSPQLSCREACSVCQACVGLCPCPNTSTCLLPAGPKGGQMQIQEPGKQKASRQGDNRVTCPVPRSLSSTQVYYRPAPQFHQAFATSRPTALTRGQSPPCPALCP